MLFRFLSALVFILVIAQPGTVSADQEYWEYTFRPGDSVWKIAEKYTTSVKNWYEIQKINQIRQGPDRKIRPGARIVIPVSMLKLQPTPAKVVAAGSGAELIRANGEKQQVSVDSLLYSGDRVVTGPDQTLRLMFADKSELQILPNSEVILDKLSQHKSTGMVDTRIRLNSGSINTRVEKQGSESHYEIRTPAAVTAVRGTAFRLSTDQDQVSRTEVTEGIVGVSAASDNDDSGDRDERSVPDGYGIVAEKDKPIPEPVKLLDAPIISKNRSVDQTVLEVSWTKPDDAVAFRYQLANDPDFDNIELDTSTTENKLRIVDLVPGHYFLRVRAVDKLKLEGIDATAGYEIKHPPPPPTPVEQDNSWKIVMGIGILILLLL